MMAGYYEGTTTSPHPFPYRYATTDDTGTYPTEPAYYYWQNTYADTTNTYCCTTPPAPVEEPEAKPLPEVIEPPEHDGDKSDTFTFVECNLQENVEWPLLARPPPGAEFVLDLPFYEPFGKLPPCPLTCKRIWTAL